MASYQLGPDTFRVPMELHRVNREKLLRMFKADSKNGEVIILKGGESQNRHETDHEELFRQESYFHYLFGVKEPDCWGAIDVASGRAFLFIPRLPEAYAVWMGKIHPPSHYQQLYGVEEARYVDELAKVLSEELQCKTIHVMHGVNSDSGNAHKEIAFPGIENFTVEKQRLFPVLSECRVIKSPLELDLLRYVNRVSSEAHKQVMRQIKPGMSEFQMESIFLHECYFKGGCRHTSYTCICASGENGAILHYGHAAAPNSKQLHDGDMVVFDMGVEYHCYASDITCSFPVNGKFTADQRIVYETVLAAQQAVMREMKPGVEWGHMHRLANRVICQELKRHGLLKGEVDEMMKHHVGALFMPHGLGHFLGIDTHDVGGYPKGMERIPEPGIKSLRTLRKLEAGMVITVEPGIYFIEHLLDRAAKDPAHSQFLNMDVINRFRRFGGVRIEDDVIITENGIENMTKAPRTVEEIEAWMSGRTTSSLQRTASRT
jgi:Xaa-Pro dipeptidase